MPVRPDGTGPRRGPPVRHTSCRRTRGTGRTGAVSVIAMLYVVLLSTLALGFFASTTMSAQLSGNQERAFTARLAAESGMEFMRHQMASMNLPYGTNSSNLLGNCATALGENLNGSANMGGRTVAVTGGTIYIPSSTGWVTLDADGRSRFRAAVTQTAGTTTLVVTVHGAVSGTQIVRGVRLEYQPENTSYSLCGLNGVTMSGNAYTDSYDSSKGSYARGSAGKGGSIVSNGDIALSGYATVNGDARPGFGVLFLLDNAVVTGRKSPTLTRITYPSVTIPAGATNLGSVNNSGGTTDVPGGTYVIDSLKLSGTAVINWKGPVKLYIKNSYEVSGDVVINTFENKPANRQLFFLPTCRTATWSGNNTCVGDLYAPDTDFVISGSVRKLGRITARSITNSSSGGMHADLALPTPGGSGGFAPVPATYVEVP